MAKRRAQCAVKRLTPERAEKLLTKGETVLFRNGKPAGALIPIDRYRVLRAIERLVSNRDRLKKLIEYSEMLDAGKEIPGSQSLDEFVRKLQSQNS